MLNPVWVRASREGLKVPLATDAGPDYFDFSAKREFKKVESTKYIRRRINDGNLIAATADEARALEDGSFAYPAPEAEGLTEDAGPAQEPPKGAA